MKKTTPLFCGLALAAVMPLSAIAQDATSCIKMHFSGSVNSDYSLLVMGANEGEYTLSWGDGTTTTGSLLTTATAITGKLPSQDLTLYGDIAVLECSGNGLTTLDVSQMPQLTDLASRKNYVQNLDLSNNTALRTVYIQDTPLTALDLTANAEIQNVVLTNNSLSTLSLGQNPALQYLACGSNGSLTELNLAGCPALKHLDAMQTNVSKYDLTNSTDLQYVAVGLGRNGIQQFLLPADNHIDTLMIFMANISSLDLSQTKNLKVLAVDNNWMLEQLDLTGMTQLKELTCSGTSIYELNFEDATELESVDCNSCPVSVLDFSNCSKLETLICYAAFLEELNIEGCDNLKYMDCSFNEMLTDITLPVGIKELNCGWCAFESLDFTAMEDLEYLYCDGNYLTQLPMGNKPVLATFCCSDNMIESLNLGNMPALVDVMIGNNPIKSGITFDAASNLRYVSVDDTELDVPALDALYTSLREAREEDAYNDLGGLFLMNSVVAAPQSNTAIAANKGWYVLVEGDASGSEVVGIKQLPSHLTLHGAQKQMIDGVLQIQSSHNHDLLGRMLK